MSGRSVVRTALAAFAVLAMLAGSAAADEPAKRKKTSDRFTKAASEAFAAAVQADQNNDLRTALGLYQKAFTISPHPSTIYNIADVQRRLGQLTEAIKSYETYLAMSQTAADRAEVEALVDKLGKTPGYLFFATSDPSDPNSLDLTSAYILVDGAIEVRPGGAELLQTPETGVAKGIERMLPPGTKQIDVVTPLTYGHQYCVVKPGERTFCRLTAPPRTDGNVVISGPERDLRVHLDRRERFSDSKVQSRFERPPGKARLYVRDHDFECAPLVLDVPTGGHVAYAYLSTQEPSTYQRCRKLDIRRLKLEFAP